MREKLKNLLIVLLGLLMCVLFMINMALGLGEESLLALRSRFGRSDQRASGQTVLDEPAVLPVKLTLRGPGGLHLAYGAESESLLGSVSPILSEALGSVGKITPISEQEYLRCLSGEHIGFTFSFPVPFYLLQHWWTGETGFSSDQSASTLVIASAEETVILAFCDGSSGQHYLAETAAGYERFTGICREAPAGNAFYAFEQDGYHMLSAHEAVWSDAVYFPTYTVANPDFSEEGRISDGLLSAFDINPFLAEVYKESDGDIVYIEGYAALQFTKAGRVVYSVTGDGGIPLNGKEGLSEKERQAYTVRRAAAILEQISTAADCDGGYSIAGITPQADGYILTFERMLGGGFVTEADGYSAVVTVKGERITGIRVALSASTENGSAMMLPVTLATALVEGENNSFCVRYVNEEGNCVPALYSMEGTYDGME